MASAIDPDAKMGACGFWDGITVGDIGLGVDVGEMQEARKKVLSASEL